MLRAGAHYTDLTPTQYASAADWLITLGFLVRTHDGLALAPALTKLAAPQIMQRLYERILEDCAPAWLPDSDVLIPDATELPQDAVGMARALGVDSTVAFLSIRSVQARVDLVARARVGAAGEAALVELLERQWPGSTAHVALASDGYGYDVLLKLDMHEWHLEVKTTTRRGRLVVFLSRHEHEVGIVDPCWRLVIVGLDSENQVLALATVRHSLVLARTPTDSVREAAWQSVRHQLAPADLEPGLGFLRPWTGDLKATSCALLRDGRWSAQGSFAWLPLSQ